MLTRLDSELFPNDCEVVELKEHDQFVYLIQKNGSSSLRKEVRNKNLKVLKNEDLAKISTVDVYIRDPIERFTSCINTYVQHLQRDNKSLDYNTCIWFATQYFLNTHYLPQFHWLLNLQRFINPKCKIILHKFSDICKITNYNHKAGVNPATKKLKNTISKSIGNDIKLWFFIDQELEYMCGESYTWSEIVNKLQQHPSRSFNILTQKFIEISKCIVQD